MIWSRRHKPSESSASIRLESERLVLRPAMIEDFSQWAETRSRNVDYLKPFEPTWPPGCLTRDFFARRATRLAQEWAQDRTYAFLIFLKNGQLAGGLNINNVSRGAANYGALGYWIDESLQGNGYMTEAGFAVLDYAFSALQLSRMNAATLPHNHKSRAMLHRLGFVEEGFAKNYIQIDGRRQDHVLFGLNAHDFSGAARDTR